MPIDANVLWAVAHEVAGMSPELKIAGATGISAGDVNGVYTYMNDTRKDEPPIFKKKAWMVPSWLYLSVDNEWWVSFTEKKDRRASVGYFFSAVVEFGTLPASATNWKVAVGGDTWERQDSINIQGVPCTGAQARARATILPELGALAAKLGDHMVSIKLDPESFAKDREELKRLQSLHGAAPGPFLPAPIPVLAPSAPSQPLDGRSDVADAATLFDRATVSSDLVVLACEAAVADRQLRQAAEARLAAEEMARAALESKLAAESMARSAAESKAIVEERRRIATEKVLAALRSEFSELRRNDNT